MKQARRAIECSPGRQAGVSIRKDVQRRRRVRFQHADSYAPPGCTTCAFRPPASRPDRVPQVVVLDTGDTATCGQGYSPPWPRRGECAQSKRSREATFEGHRRGGWFNDRLSDVEPTTPAAPKSSVALHLLFAAAPPPWPRRGQRLPASSRLTSVSSG